MEQTVAQVAEAIGGILDLAGVVTIAAGSVLAVVFVTPALSRGDRAGAYATFRIGLARAILLGLEILVAADIIRTVAVEPTLENVTVLGIIVLVRTILSFTLTVEIEGRWPWQAKSPGVPERAGTD